MLRLVGKFTDYKMVGLELQGVGDGMKETEILQVQFPTRYIYCMQHFKLVSYGIKYRTNLSTQYSHNI